MPSEKAADLLAAVVSGAPIVLFAFDADGIFTLSEGRGLEVLGRKPGEAVGKSVFDLYKDHPKVVECCRRALKGRR
ncbi:MAG: PAS domain-containing protein [Elusimicrobiota bacterium]|nr:MAG: PAS domain-containing protein [Elusimicrobiota bacterium]